MAEQGSTGSTGTDQTPTGSGDSGTQTPAQGQQAPEGGAAGAGSGQERTFTQADVDRLLGERARRAGQTAVSELLKDLEIEDLDGLRGTVKAHRLAKDAESSDLEKAQAALQKLQERNKTLAAANRAQMIQSAVVVAATTLGFRNPADAHALADLSAVEITDDGKVVGVEDALKALLEGREYLKAEAAPPPAPNIDAGRGAGDGAGGEQPTYQQLLPAALRNRGSSQK